MLEKKIEDIIFQKLETAFRENGLSEYQIIRSWTPTEQTESPESKLILVLKVHPRGYETYTIPTAQFAIDVSLIARADVDYDGLSYLQATEIMIDTLHVWQRNIDQVC